MKKIDNSQALDTFVELAAEIKARVDRLQGATDDHFGLASGEINWGHVGDLTEYANVLKNLTDQIFNEGEYAADED